MKWTHTSVFFLLTMLVCLNSKLYGQINTDSLWSIWINTKNDDTTRLKSIQSLAATLYYSNIDSCYKLAKMELDLAQRKGQPKWESKAYNIFGNVLYLKGDFNGAFDNYHKALAILVKLKDQKGIAAIYNNMGMIYKSKGSITKALEYFKKSLKIDEQLNDQKSIGGSYNNIGTIYTHINRYEKAIEYFEKSIEIHTKLGAKYSIALSLSNIGSCLLNLGKDKEALNYIAKSNAIREEIKDEQGLAANYDILGHLYKKAGNTTLSLAYYNKALFLQKKQEERQGICFTKVKISDVYFDRKEYQKALNLCNEALLEAKKLGTLETQRDATEVLYRIYKAINNHAKALIYFEEFNVLKDSLLNEETKNQLEQLEFEKWIVTDSIAKNQKIQKLENEHQELVRKKNNTRNLLLITGLIIIIISISLWIRLRYFRKNSKLFQYKAETLEKQQLLNEIALLKTQVNPHFLFNSLSILSSLVRVDPDLSERFIDQLSKSYRYILEHKDHYLVSLRTELDFINAYSFLLKIRFENKFDVHYHLSEAELDKYKIAPMTLQLLMENAVKHNRMSKKEPLIVEVSIEENKLKVSNNLQVRSGLVGSTGIGLENIKNRYALLTDEPVWAGIKHEHFVVMVPLLEADIKGY